MSFLLQRNARSQSWGLRRFFNDITNKNKADNISMEDDEINQSQRFAVIYGGNTPLGGRCIADLKNDGWWVASVDFAANSHADVNILLLKEESPSKHEANIISSIRSILGGRNLDLIFCTSDAYTEGAVEDDLIKVGMDMWLAHMAPPMICAKIASVCMKNNGVLVFTASSLAMKANPDKIAYSVAQSSVVHLTKCLAMPGSGMPGDSKVVCLLPNYLDTVMVRGVNQHMHPGSFTPLQFISDLVLTWACRKSLPLTGSLCQINTNNFSTQIVYKE